LREDGSTKESEGKTSLGKDPKDGIRRRREGQNFESAPGGRALVLEIIEKKVHSEC